MIVKAGEAWNGMRADVTNFIHNCATCQSQRITSTADVLPGEAKAILSYEPFAEVSVDTLELNIDKYDKKYVFLYIDNFSKYIELQASNDKSAYSWCTFLLNMFARYGSPSIIRSDMGTEFVNTIMKELTLVFNTKHITTIGDRPQSNGIAERANREIIRHLTYVVTNKKLSDMWSLGLPLVQRILNVKIGPYSYSPSSIIFGNSVDLCRGLMSPLQQDKQVVDFNDYMSKLIDYQIKAIQVSQKFIATDGDRKAPVIQQVITFNIGDYVLVKNKVLVFKIN